MENKFYFVPITNISEITTTGRYQLNNQLIIIHHDEDGWYYESGRIGSPMYLYCGKNNGNDVYHAKKLSTLLKHVG